MRSYFAKFIFALAMVPAFSGCGEVNDSLPEEIEHEVPPDFECGYDIVPDGIESAETSTKLIFTFNTDIDGITAEDISVRGAAYITENSELSGGGTVWELPVTVSEAGYAYVVIAKDGIDGSEKTVPVHKQGEDTPDPPPPPEPPAPEPPSGGGLVEVIESDTVSDLTWTSLDNKRHIGIPRSKSRWNDGDVLEYKLASAGRGTDIVIIAEGFNKKEMEVGGVFQTTAAEFTELFFKMPIVRDLKDHFNIYFLMRVSNKSGVKNMYPDRYHGVGERRKYFTASVAEMPQIGYEKAGIATFFCLANGYAGGFADYEIFNFASMQFSDTEDNQVYWMAHEFTGHAFGGFGDLYNGHSNPDITQWDVFPLAESVMPADDITWNYPAGNPQTEACLNVFVAPWNDSVWSKFISLPGNGQYASNENRYKYADNVKGVSVFDNNLTTNVMNEINSLHFGPWDRYIIYRRIKARAGVPFSLVDFFKIDQQYIKPVSDWYAELDVADWETTYNPMPYNRATDTENSPYSAWDEPGYDTAVSVSAQGDLNNVSLSSPPLITINWDYPVTSYWDVQQPDLCFVIYDEEYGNMEGARCYIAATSSFSDDRKSATLDLGAAFRQPWSGTNVPFKPVLQKGRTYIIEHCMIDRADKSPHTVLERYSWTEIKFTVTRD